MPALPGISCSLPKGASGQRNRSLAHKPIGRTEGSSAGMRIGISTLGQLSADTGGRTYIINFVRTCIELKLPHEYFIFYSGPQEDVWGELPSNFHKVTVPFSQGSSWAKGFGLQFVMPFCAIGKRLDVIYFTNYFASILCFKPY